MHEATAEDPGNSLMMLRDGDSDGFDAFFVDEQRGLLRFCWGLTVDRDVALDVAQEAMTRAFERWDEIATGNPSGWVRTVVLNLVRNRWRSSKRRNVALQRLGAQPGSAPSMDPAVAGSTTEDVMAALRSLSGRQREAVVLHHMADWSVTEVADAMGTSVATVKTHLQRGRAALATVLNEDFEGGGDG